MPDSLFPKQAERIAVWQGDITRLVVDAIVNAANKGLLGCFASGHHCIDNAIHTAAGVQLRAECHSLMKAQGHPEETGSAKITQGYNLPAKHVIHTVGPQVNGIASHEQERQLENCYRACFDAAISQGMHIVAFCHISTRIFGFPRYRAARIATKVIREQIIKERAIRVVFNVFMVEDSRVYESILSN